MQLLFEERNLQIITILSETAGSAFSHNAVIISATTLRPVRLLT